MPHKEIFIYIPANFDPMAVLPADLAQYADCARYFLHRIIWARVQRNITPEGYVPIKWDYFRKVIPDRVLSRIRTVLLSHNVIACDNYYIEGNKSYGYRLCPPYSEAGIVRTTVQHTRTAARIKENRTTERRKITLDIHKYLRSQLQRLEIDLPYAMHILNGHPHHEIVKIPALQIASREFSCSVCRYGRFHSDLTRCAKSIRPALHVAGQSLVCLDIKNSQPLFLALVVMSYRKVGKKALGMHTAFDIKKPYEGIDNILANIVKPFPHNTETDITTTTHLSNTTRIEGKKWMQVDMQEGLVASESTVDANPVNRERLAVDEQRFVRLCEEGRLYEELMSATETPVRSWIKTGLFEVLYGRNSCGLAHQESVQRTISWCSSGGGETEFELILVVVRVLGYVIRRHGG